MLEFAPFNHNELQIALNVKATEIGFVDAIFPGSNTSMLTNLLAYAVSMNNANTSFLFSEFFLNTATKRKNILKIARMLGYEVKRKTSYQYKIMLRCEPPKDIVSTQTFNTVLKKYTEFTDGNNSYAYMESDLEILGITPQQVEDETAIYNQLLNIQGYVSAEDLDKHNLKTFFFVTIKEGTIFRYFDKDYCPDGLSDLCFTMVKTIQPDGTLATNYTIPLDYEEVEKDGIEVFVSRYNSLGFYENKEKWMAVPFQDVDFKKFNFEKSYVTLRDIETNTASVYFKFSGVVDEPILNAEVFINVLVSKGVNGVAQGKISFKEPNPYFNIIPIGVTDNAIYTVFTYTKELVAGSDEESDTQIKETAAVFHNVANRAVTAQDYSTILRQNQSVFDASTWGGEDYVEESLGNVYCACVPTKTTTGKSYLNVNGASTEFKRIYNIDNENEFYFPDSTLQNLKTYIEGYSIMTLKNHIVQPLYFDMDIVVRLTKNIFDTNILNNIINTVTSLFDGKYEKFDIEFFRSGISKIIYTAIGDTNGVDISTTQKIVISKYNIKNNTKYLGQTDKYIEFFLPMPFIDFTTLNYEIKFEELPQISTFDFLSVNKKRGTNNLVVSTLPGATIKDGEVITLDILYNGTKCGEYKISMLYGKRFIYVKLDLAEPGSQDDKNVLSSLLTTDFLDENQKLNFKFSNSSEDSKYMRNSICRLNYFKISSEAW